MHFLKKPGCSLNEAVMPNTHTITSLLPEKRVKKLQEAWPMLESALHEYDVTCILDPAERCVTVSTTKTTKRPDSVLDNARQLLELLSTTHVPLSMAIDIMKGRSKHILIKIGNQEGGLSSMFGIKKEEYLERWKCLFCSLQELAKLTRCNIFLNETTVLATSFSVSPGGFGVLSAIVEDCIAYNICPGCAAEKHLKFFPVLRLMDDLKDPHIKHMEREESGQLLIEDSLLEASALYTSFHENQATKLQEAWPMVESSLKAYGISCTLNLVERYMTVSTTKRTSDPCIIDKARDLLELLSTTHVLPSLAIEILNGSRHHILVKMGDQEGGLCSKFGIKKEQFVQRRECLYSSLEELSEFGYCHLFLNECNVTAVGTSPDGLEMIRMIVEDCIVNNVCPATALRDIYLKCKPYTRPEDWKDPHNKHLEMDAVYGLPEMTSLYVVFPERKANKLEEEWPIVESCLQEYDVSCFLGDCSITLSKRTSGDLDIICKAWDLLVLLSETNVPALTSIKILKGSLQHDIIKIGLQDDGVCSRLGFKKEQYAILRRRLKHSLQKLELNLGCQLLMNGSTIVAFGTSSTLKRTRDLLEAWMIEEGSREYGASKDDVKQ